MGKYFKVKVEFRLENENGKIKTEKVEYLVDACSVTEAEVKTVHYLTERDEKDFDVLSATSSSIAEVISSGFNVDEE